MGWGCGRAFIDALLHASAPCGPGRWGLQGPRARHALAVREHFASLPLTNLFVKGAGDAEKEKTPRPKGRPEPSIGSPPEASGERASEGGRDGFEEAGVLAAGRCCGRSLVVGERVRVGVRDAVTVGR